MVTVTCTKSIAAALGLLIATAPPLAGQDVGLEIGTRPEAVVIEDLDGNDVDLGAVIGSKPVLLEFWATWCPLCEALEPQMHAVEERFGNAIDVLVVAVGVNQSPNSIRRHLARHALPGRVLWDGRGRATRAFAAPTTSYVVILDAGGRVVYTGVGEDQELVQAVGKVLGAEARE